MAGLSSTQREAVRDIAAICAQATDSRELRRRFADRLSRILSWDAACFGTIDPWTLLVTDDLSDRIPDGVYALAARNEYLVDDVHKFATLARSESGVGIISQAPEAWRERSPRLRSILPTFGAAHEVRAACVVEGQCWGAVVLFRTGDSPDFTADDAALLRAVTQPLALGLRRTANTPAAFADVTTVEDGPGVMILGPGNEPMVVNDAAQRWLDELTPAPGAHELPVAVHQVAARARNVSALGGLSAYSRIRTRAGRWLTLHGSPASGSLAVDDGVAVILNAAPASEITQVLMLVYGLTPRERDVLQPVLAGASSKIIAAQLHISVNTVQDHLKAIFAKVGVRSRPQLVARLLDQHYLPAAG